MLPVDCSLFTLAPILDALETANKLSAHFDHLGTHSSAFSIAQHMGDTEDGCHCLSRDLSGKISAISLCLATET